MTGCTHTLGSLTCTLPEHDGKGHVYITSEGDIGNEMPGDESW